MGKKNVDSIQAVTADEWRTLSEKKVYFGHQSVGFNIIDGVKDILRENPTHPALNVAETKNISDFQHPVFAHSRIGENTKPLTKVDDFIATVEGGIGNKADVVFFKLCYVDINQTTDVKAIFDYYKKKMRSLEEKYPRTTFIHVTVPLTTIQTGFKMRIKKMIGRGQDGSEDNIKRNEFNELMRREYQGKKPLFDLARMESTYPDGTHEQFTQNGTPYRSMVPEYTYDGGHLNELARKNVARELLKLLAKNGK